MNEHVTNKKKMKWAASEIFILQIYCRYLLN